MKDEDKIYGLIAQAEDIQAYAINLQKAAQDAFKTLPAAVREAARAEAREIITEASKNASEGILRASNEAKAVSASMKSVWLLHALFLILVASVIAGSGFYFLRQKLIELAEVREQIAKSEYTLELIEAKTWGLELVSYSDGTRGIILPKGADIKHTGQLKDGRMGVVVIPAKNN